MDPLFARTSLLLGTEAMERLKASRIAVAGIGGVGSYTVEALARSSVGHMLLIDDDTVCPSNINRQIHATTQTIGRPKALLMAERIKDIHPDIQVDTQEAFLLPDNVDTVITGHLDYIVDAVDTVSAKLALVELASKRNIPIISVMGAGNKLDPTQFVVGDIFQTDTCPLCRVMRRELRKKGIPSLEVVYSTEMPRTPLPSPTSQESGAHPKRQTPGSVAFVPSVAGLIAAGVVVRRIADIEL